MTGCGEPQAKNGDNMQKIKFFDSETGMQICGEVRRTGYVASQQWADVRANGVDWAVPMGWPNNATPICKESAPEAYREIISLISAE